MITRVSVANMNTMLAKPALAKTALLASTKVQDLLAYVLQDTQVDFSIKHALIPSIFYSLQINY